MLREYRNLWSSDFALPASAYWLISMLETVHQVPALLDRISAAIESSPHLPAGKIRVESGTSGQVRLHGKVQTFFEKQMAQETIRSIAGENLIENMVEVTW